MCIGSALCKCLQKQTVQIPCRNQLHKYQNQLQNKQITTQTNYKTNKLQNRHNYTTKPITKQNSIQTQLNHNKPNPIQSITLFKTCHTCTLSNPRPVWVYVRPVMKVHACSQVIWMFEDVLCDGSDLK